MSNAYLIVGIDIPAEDVARDVEYTTMEWVDWFNNRRLHSQLDYCP